MSSEDTHASLPGSISSQPVCVRCAINRFLRDKDMLHSGYYERTAGDKLKIGTKGDESQRVGCFTVEGSSLK